MRVRSASCAVSFAVPVRWRRAARSARIAFSALIVSAEFAGLRPIQRHQRVYAALGARMHSDEVHALSMKTFTPAEWAAQPT